jgi:hypothetical protein
MVADLEMIRGPCSTAHPKHFTACLATIEPVDEPKAFTAEK